MKSLFVLLFMLIWTQNSFSKVESNSDLKEVSDNTVMDRLAKDGKFELTPSQNVLIQDPAQNLRDLTVQSGKVTCSLYRKDSSNKTTLAKDGVWRDGDATSDYDYRDLKLTWSKNGAEISLYCRPKIIGNNLDWAYTKEQIEVDRKKCANINGKFSAQEEVGDTLTSCETPQPTYKDIKNLLANKGIELNIRLSPPKTAVTEEVIGADSAPRVNTGR